MYEKKTTTIKVPQAYLPLIEDLRLLKSDGHNPNYTTIAQQNQIWKSLQKYGWTYPITTNQNGVFADGEQRAKVCLEHEEYFAPVLRLPMADVDRRMLRQILNKLKGKHKRELDASEFLRIIEEGEKDSLEVMLESIGQKLPQKIPESDSPISIPQSYEIIIECKDQEHQRMVYEKLKLEGYKLRTLTL